MTELVTVQQIEEFLQALRIAGPIVGALVGLAVGLRRHCWKVGLWQGVGVGLLVGPIIYALWGLHGTLMSYSPATGEAGLHKVWVHVVSALIFIVVGLELGAVYRRGVFPYRECAADEEAPLAPDKLSDQQ